MTPENEDKRSTSGSVNGDSRSAADTDQTDENMENKTSTKKKYPWTARRIAALIGIILLLAMYGMTMVFALMDSPVSNGLLMASIFCTIAVPILLYAMEMVAKNLRGKGVARPEDTYEDADDGNNSDNTETADDGNNSDNTETADDINPGSAADDVSSDNAKGSQSTSDKYDQE